MKQLNFLTFALEVSKTGHYVRHTGNGLKLYTADGELVKRADGSSITDAATLLSVAKERANVAIRRQKDDSCN